ncbi:MAG: histidine phosphatase family protein [Burkholderiales bacterium]|jgi:probable phosphoglycerate mutase|uniref:Histidine phosphatase family protein n=1 Tax=Polynucleobacter sp. UK-FUSCHL-C3 TaxID=2955208 RepID=A0AAU8A0V6_9BURK|nr:histidine phosphatase family protein [Burkholderiales bacterium]NBP20694.1 histidine phosphatase family protein [Burkholderiaceae bacterium]NBP46743.1 histidine phosphatase family protein [Burkholderiaceae bacterium]NBP92753.1 histidine phosphatase family protein [Burkholderiaceae bacterium]NBQ29345.1 histidine phosphatase family protein [Burkholderiaceae bacterium]
MSNTRICFVRHGETNWNAERRMQGHIDIPLNANGISQAERLANALIRVKHSFDVIYSSDLERALHTANAVARALSLDVQITPRLRERNVGKLQGLLLAEAPVLLPEIWQRHIARELDHDLGGGESIRTFHQRMQDILELFLNEHRGQSVLAVSHGGSLDMIYRIVTQQALDAERVAVVPNTSLNWITHDGSTWSVECWADTSHLSESALDDIEI